MNEIDRNDNNLHAGRYGGLHIPDSSSEKEYSIEDDEEKDDEEDEEDEENLEDEEQPEGDDDDGEEKKDQSPFMLMLEMMINPVNGWKRFRRAHFTTERVGAGCFYPLVGIAAASCFIDCFYDNSVTMSMAMVSAVKVFVSFFFGNFVALMALHLLMPGKFKDLPDTPFGKQFVMLMLSTLALFWTLYECLPMLGPILFFLPLWTIYLTMRGVRFFRFPEEKKSLLTTLICVSILGSPFLIYYIFDLFL